MIILLLKDYHLLHIGQYCFTKLWTLLKTISLIREIFLYFFDWANAKFSLKTTMVWGRLVKNYTSWSVQGWKLSPPWALRTFALLKNAFSTIFDQFRELVTSNRPNWPCHTLFLICKTEEVPFILSYIVSCLKTIMITIGSLETEQSSEIRLLYQIGQVSMQQIVYNDDMNNKHFFRIRCFVKSWY